MFGIVETGSNLIVKVSDWVSKRKTSELIEKYVEQVFAMVTDGYVKYPFFGERQQVYPRNSRS